MVSPQDSQAPGGKGRRCDIARRRNGAIRAKLDRTPARDRDKAARKLAVAKINRGVIHLLTHLDTMPALWQLRARRGPLVSK